MKIIFEVELDVDEPARWYECEADAIAEEIRQWEGVKEVDWKWYPSGELV